MTKLFTVKWTADSKPYEFMYDTYSSACQFAYELIRKDYEPIIEVSFIK